MEPQALLEYVRSALKGMDLDDREAFFDDLGREFCFDCGADTDDEGNCLSDGCS
jgi:hypothetical protein